MDSKCDAQANVLWKYFSNEPYTLARVSKSDMQFCFLAFWTVLASVNGHTSSRVLEDAAIRTLSLFNCGQVLNNITAIEEFNAGPDHLQHFQTEQDLERKSREFIQWAAKEDSYYTKTLLADAMRILAMSLYSEAKDGHMAENFEIICAGPHRQPIKDVFKHTSPSCSCCQKSVSSSDNSAAYSSARGSLTEFEVLRAPEPNPVPKNQQEAFIQAQAKGSGKEQQMIAIKNENTKYGDLNIAQDSLPSQRIPGLTLLYCDQ